MSKKATITRVVLSVGVIYIAFVAGKFKAKLEIDTYKNAAVEAVNELKLKDAEIEKYKDAINELELKETLDETKVKADELLRKATESAKGKLSDLRSAYIK